MQDANTSSVVAQLGFGGGCHWCTEAVFDHLKGVYKVRQGWIKSVPPFDSFSEAVLLDYNPKVIPTEVLVQIHLHTHSSASDHSMREKYRSAIYFLDQKDEEGLNDMLERARVEEGENYLTHVLPFVEFKLNSDEFLDYFKKRPDAPFCQRHIRPKLDILMEKFSENVRSIDRG